MSKLNRLFDLASKALDGGGDRRGDAARSGGTDWRGMIRGAADAFTGDTKAGAAPAPAGGPGLAPPASGGGGAPQSGPGLTPPAAGQPGAADRAAIARYDYLMQTADPHQIELIHRDAFARLTPEQRTHIERRMQTELPPHERPRSSSAPDLARAAARTEATAPGRLRGLLGRAGRGAAGVGVAGAAVGVLGAVAGGAIVSGVAGSLLEQAAGWGVDFDALANGIDLEGVAGDALGGAGEVFGGAEEAIGGAAEQVGGWGEQLSSLEIPGLGDLWGR